MPPNETQEEDSNGGVNYYVLIEREHSKDILWRQKLGEALANQLREKKGQQIRSRVLKEFPSGYSLYWHHSRRDRTVDIRKDAYLYGKINSPRFRSPNEFAPHLYWLATNREEPCKCKYCAKLKTTPQTIVDTKRSRTKITSTAVVKSKKPNIVKKEKISRTFRVGEIVWFNISEASDSNFASIAGLIDLDHHVLQYWPSIVHHFQQQSPPPGTEGDITYYTVRLLALSTSEIVMEKSLRPWLFYRSTIPTNTSTDRFSEVNQAQLLKYYEAYKIAITAANSVIESYCPRNNYVYVESEVRLMAVDEQEKVRMKQMTTFPHYREIFIGAEKIREWDFVRLRPENQSSSSEGSSSSTTNNKSATEKNEYFHVSTIYYHRGKGIQFTGDLYEMALPAITENPQIEEHFNWIPLNETNEEYTIELSDVMGRFYIDYPNLDDSMPIQANNMKDEKGRNELLGAEAPPFASELEEDESYNINSNLEKNYQEISSSLKALTRKRPLQEPQSNQLQKKQKHDDSKSKVKENNGKSIEHVIESNSHSNENPSRVSSRRQEKRKVASNKEVEKSNLAGTTPVNPPASICWSGRISWPKSADQRSLQGAPSLTLRIPKKMSWNFGIEIMTYSIPVVSTQKRNIYESFPRNLTISAISNVAPFQAYDQSMGDLVYFFPDSNYPFLDNNNLNFNVLAQTLKDNSISAVASSGKLTIFFKSDDGTTIIGLCSRDRQESTIQSNNSNNSNRPVSKNIRCFNIKTKQKVTIEISNLRSITALLRKLGEEFNIPLQDLKRPEDVVLRFLDKDQQTYYVLGEHEHPIREKNSKFTDSLDFVKEHAVKLIVEYERQASI
ncbi:2524_t:CDS:2 [Ambispora gerdemannii]|uniref:2524_t:CDS:1 n=1 Tax=Ambispora gerdemannii TaxID=144530 RepID=A0A9N8YR17_9GLOM|nr:2524_t:CDS:2 [Ambispora gerdemannii]